MDEYTGDFEKFNIKDFSYIKINKFFNNKKAYTIKEIEDFIKDTVACVVNGGNSFYVTKDCENNNKNCEFKVIKKLENLNEKIKIINDDDDDRAKKYKYVTFKSILMNVLYDISYARYKFIPHGPFEKDIKKSYTSDGAPYYLNVYNGTPIKYIKDFIFNKELIKPILNHIKYVLADGIDNNYNYILKMLAHMVKKPHIKTGVCMVFISSSEGAGKNIFWDNFGTKIIGKNYYTQLNDIDTLMGPFNSILSNKILTVLDEVKTKFGGKSSDRFKSMITTRDFILHQKGMDHVHMEDYNNYIVLSNNDIPVMVGANDRRFFITNVSNKYVGKDKYFDDLAKAWESYEIVEHFYHYLCNIDLKDFKPQKEIPVTDRKIEIKQETIGTPIKFLIEVAKNKFKEITKKNSDELYDIYQEYCYEELEVKPNRKLDFFKGINKFIDNPNINSERKKIYTLSKNTIIEKLKILFNIDSLDCFDKIEYTISSDDEPNNPDKVTSSESSSSNKEEDSITSDTSQNSENLESLENDKIILVNEKNNVYKCKVGNRWKFGNYSELKKIKSKELDNFLKKNGIFDELEIKS